MKTQLAPTSGAMGYSIPAAISAKIAKKSTPVIAFCGVAETHEEIDKTFDRVFSLVDSNVSIQVAMEEPAKVLKNKVDSCRLMIEQLLL